MGTNRDLVLRAPALQTPSPDSGASFGPVCGVMLGVRFRSLTACLAQTDGGSFGDCIRTGASQLPYTSLPLGTPGPTRPVEGGAPGWPDKHPGNQSHFS